MGMKNIMEITLNSSDWNNILHRFFRNIKRFIQISSKLQ